MTRDHVSDFAHFVAENSKVGHNGYDQSAEYISRAALEGFWTREKVTHALSARNLNEPSYSIVSSYVAIFSILAYIGKLDNIGKYFMRFDLDDKHLPFFARPTQWPDNPPNKTLYEEFFDNQWRFCPLEFRNGLIHNRKLLPARILPVTFKERLNQQSAGRDVSIISKIEIHDECNDKKIIPTNTVVFKVYQTDDAINLFDTEIGAYVNFPSHSGCITRYYGSFEQNGKRTIILEHAPGGTLLHFYKMTRPLHNNQERTALWEALFQLLKGLLLIHGMRPPSDVDSRRWLFSTIHNDLHPANILVFPQESGQPYDVKFKLADFGTSHIRNKLSGSKDVPVITSDANRMYLAPESCKLFDVHELVGNPVDQTIDIWALGAIFSEALVWTVWGEDGRERYRQRRKDELSQVTLFQGSGYNTCFHNGVSRLEVVEAIHEEALEHTRRNDILSSYISDLILDHMLQRRDGGRLDTHTTLIKAQGVWKKADRGSRSILPPLRSPSRASGTTETNRFDESSLGSRLIHTTDGSCQLSAPSQRLNDLAPTGPLFPSFGVDGNSLYPPTVPNPLSSLQGFAQYPNTNFERLIPGSGLPPDSGSKIASPASPHADLRNSPSSPTIPTGGLNGQSQHPPPPIEIPTRKEVYQLDITPSRTRTSLFGPSKRPGGGRGESETITPSQPTYNLLTHAPTEEQNKVTIDMVYPRLAAKPDGLIRRFSNNLRRNASDIMKLQGIPQALAHVKAGGSREQMLLIDDFGSMSTYRLQVQWAARVIGYYVKKLDPNTTELFFASDVSTPSKHSNSSDLEAAIHEHDFVPGNCNMELALGSILERVMIQVEDQGKPVSIYVFTDGVWEPGHPGVDKIIAQAAQNLVKGNVIQHPIMIQFIRFGHDLTGIERLKHLDDGIVRKFKLEDRFDIVDTKSYDDHIPHILVGSLSRFNDDQTGSTLQ